MNYESAKRAWSAIVERLVAEGRDRRTAIHRAKHANEAVYLRFMVAHNERFSGHIPPVWRKRLAELEGVAG